jgi:hypothetical protein
MQEMQREFGEPARKRTCPLAGIGGKNRPSSMRQGSIRSMDILGILGN